MPGRQLTTRTRETFDMRLSPVPARESPAGDVLRGVRHAPQHGQSAVVYARSERHDARGSSERPELRRWSSRRPRPRSCGSSPARRPTSNPFSMRSWQSAARLCDAHRRGRLPGSTGDVLATGRRHGPTPDRSVRIACSRRAVPDTSACACDRAGGRSTSMTSSRLRSPRVPGHARAGPRE